MEASHKHVLVVFEPGRAGAAAIDLAHELAEHDRAKVTVLGVVPMAPSGSRCGNSATEYNHIVRDAVGRELAQAREQLAGFGERAAFKLLAEGTDPPLPDWVRGAGVDVVLLPARRRPLRSAKHPAAVALRRGTDAEIRIVDAR
jgi:hypothetical protein